MKIIDAHHHYWDPDDNPHPWLTEEPMIPFRYGDYSAIRGRFLPPEYDAATAGWDVVATVTMEGEWDPADPTGEAVWMQALSDQTNGRPAAHVAQAWLDRDDLSTVLERYADLPVVRSVRHKPRSNPGPGQGTGAMSEAHYQAGYRRLAQTDLMFDLQTNWWHLPEIAGLRRISEDVPIIINHTGLPADRSPEGISGWQEALRSAASFPNVFLKISGIGLKGRPWRLDDNRDIIRFSVDTFGPERAMFASNFPVDNLCGSFDTIFAGFDSATADYSVTERDALFRGTAARVYNLAI
ncbi:amidohydrolase family protein [Ponticoccus alexandrii]|uniref:Amidohydrolase family protein n=1 Tax=Ponticoccus alexandrii TaxID=1943633 RepID=A0ABX7FG61_9RHOB|nr:amidohydrolase family protein [Ponticoccus alexandrii]ETA51179.2 thioesterase [Rhodobacteraceae bacterium PD-2]QRF69115.1 amidohydrolase family protein [Ponticoccus alexandrii]